MRIVNLTEETRKNILKDLLKRSPSNFGSYADTVEKIVNDVRDRGDEALFGYTKQFDKANINAGNVLVTKEEIEYAYTQVDEKLIEVIRKAKENIRTYHEKQRQYSWFDSDPKGIMLGQKVTALESVGVYVPGGKAVYPSSVLMNIMPAKVAGVKNIIMTTPCNSEGEVYATTLVAANEAGATAIYKAGGAQAIAALAYGTESIPKVDKIVISRDDAVFGSLNNSLMQTFFDNSGINENHSHNEKQPEDNADRDNENQTNQIRNQYRQQCFPRVINR